MLQEAYRRAGLVPPGSTFSFELHKAELPKIGGMEDAGKQNIRGLAGDPP
jgi:hypothetical protein